MKEVNHDQLYFGSVKWTDLFDSEEELLESVKGIDIKKYKSDWRKGYEVVGRAQLDFAGKGKISSAQLTQLKRLAKEIYKYHNGL